jgi:excisionase family DNA binding protein
MTRSRETDANSLLDVRAAAALLRISPFSLYHWISEKRGIPVIRLSSRCVRFRRSDLQAWIAGKCVPPVASDAEEKKSR